MTYFTDEYLKFFKELAGNNNKDWFDKNRKRYEKEVKDTFKKFIDDLIEKMKEIDDRIDITSSQAIFRINRDIRFSKDKTPYKLNRSAIISPGGKKDKSVPGLYIESNCEDFRIYGGVYMASTEQVLRVREEIADHLDIFKKAYQDKDFVKTFGEVHGEKAKRLPKHLHEAAEKEPMIFNKQWYYYVKLDPETILSEDLLDIVLAHYTIAKPMMDFLHRPIVG